MKSIITVSLLFIFQITYSQSLFVDDATGSNSNTGTTIGAPWKTIQYAMDNATAGSIVYIRGGSYYETLEMNVSGTSASPITFTNYNGENVYIDGNNTAVTLLYIGGKSNLIIKGLVFQNTLGNNSAGIIIEGKSKNITFRKNKIQHINWTASASTIPSSNKNSNPFVVFGNNATVAITNLTIDSNEVSDNITGFSESLTLDGNVDGFVIAANNVHDNVNIGILCAGNYKVSSDPSTDHARNGVVKNNLVYNCVSNYATSGGIYVDGGKNIIVEKNKSYGNGYGIEIGCEEVGTTTNITVRNNILFDNQIAGLAIGGYNYPSTGQVLDCLIENNTLLKNDNATSGSGEITITKATNCTFRNNIIYTSSQNITISSAYNSLQSSLFNYNAYYTPSGNSSDAKYIFNSNTYTGLNNFQSSTSQESSGLYGDPKLVNSTITSPATIDFTLQSGSPCIDAGAPNHTIVSEETDYYNFNRIANSTIDIGASEYGSVVAGINNDIQNFSFTTFPNPASDLLEIRIDPNILIDKISICNELGKEMIVTSSTSIGIAEFPKGFYFIKINTSKGTFAQKILKQ